MMRDKPIKILLIEDNPGDARLIREMLQERNSAQYDLEWVDLLDKGLKRLATKGIDLVLLDLGLPDSQGLFTFFKVNSLEKRVPIIVLTGLEDEILGINAVRKGAQDYIVKTQVDGRVVVRSIRYAIERKKSEEALRESREMYKTLLQTSQDAVTVVDLEGKILEASRRMLEVYGFKKVVELQGKSVFELIAPEDRKKVLMNLKKTFKERISRNGLYVMLKKDGTRFIGELNTSLINDAYGNPKAMITITSDMADCKQAKETIRELAHPDPLTGLPHRRGFLVLAQQQLKIANRLRKRMVLVLADLDDLKSINDNQGHHEGDQALIGIANILRENFRMSDIIARVGGDEFAILAIEDSVKCSEILFNRLKENLDAHNLGGRRLYKLSMSISTAFYDPECPCSIDELLDRANESICRRKKRKKQVIKNG